MLRPWFKRTAVLVLGAEGIVLRRAGAQDIRLISSSVEPYTGERLLDELHKQAGELGLQRVHFILSNQFARYAVLPWQPDVYAMQDWLALAVHQFRKQFGTVAESWELRVALQGYGKPAVACALDRELVERLLLLSAESGWTVQGIEPALMTVFNRHRNHLAKVTQWLLLAEPQRLLLAHLTGDVWQNFYIDSPLAGEEPTAGQRMVERTIRLQGGERPSAIACFGPATLLSDSLDNSMSNGIPMVRLPHPALGKGAGQLDKSSLDLLAAIA